MRTALVAGASGLVGRHLLDELLDSPRWDRVVSLGRRELDIAHPRLEQRLVTLPDFGDLGGVDDAFCCLGTTMRQAGSREAFRHIDHDAVVALARASARGGASAFLHVTALGADPGSRVFYNRVKGETERDVAEVGPGTTVAFRPSILDGERAESRPAERAGLAAMRILAPVLGRYRPTRAADLARAMLAEAADPLPGHRVVSARDIAASTG